MITFPQFPEPKPTALNRAVEQLLKLWPLDDTPQELPLVGAEAARIRALILATTPGTQLKRRDVRATFRLCLDDTEPPEWTSKAILVLVSMPEIPGFASLYELYAGFYTNNGLRQCTSMAYAKLPTDQRKIPLERVEKVLGKDPIGELTWDTLVKLRPVSETIASCRISKSSALSLATYDATYRIAFDELAVKEHVAWIQTHSALQWIELLGNHYGTSQQRLYLVGRVVRAWGMIKGSVREVIAHKVLNALLDRVTLDDMLGDPIQRKSLWEQDHDLFVLVRKWMLDKKIQDFFDLVDANPDRKNYWRSKVDIISDYEDLSFGRSAFAMMIGRIWFVEFGEHGNACYPYNSEAYASVRRGRYQSVTWEVDPLKIVGLVYNPVQRQYGTYSRTFNITERRTLIHSPKPSDRSRGWYEKFDAYIKAYCDFKPE